MSRRFDAALAHAASKCQAAPDGDRTQRIWSQARWIGTIVHDGGSREAAIDALVRATVSGGGNERDARYHITRGVDAGMEHPDTSSAPDNRPPKPPPKQIDIAARMAAAMKPTMQRPQAPRVYETAADFRARKRISDGVWGLAEIRDQGDRIAYPVTTIHGATLTRHRILTRPKAIPCWEGEVGAVEAIYGAQWWARYVDLPVYWCNGESSVWSAASVMVDAACGCTGENVPSDGVLAALMAAAGTRQIRVCYDLDRAGVRQSRAVVARLRELGADVAGVTLPDSLGAGGDLGDLCIREGERALHALMEVATWI